MQELAWASFALIKNTNSCGVILLGPGSKVLLARGALGSAVLKPGNPAATLELMTQVLFLLGAFVTILGWRAQNAFSQSLCLLSDGLQTLNPLSA